jgi:hypothetical protein
MDQQREAAKPPWVLGIAIFLLAVLGALGTVAYYASQPSEVPYAFQKQ